MKLINNTFCLICGLLLSQNPGYSQTPGERPVMPLTLNEYLNQVGTGNLDYIAEKFNIQIAEAEIIAAKVLPDPEIEFEAGEEYYSVELSYDLEIWGKRRARVRLAKSEAELERLAVEYFFLELKAEAGDAFMEALKEKEVLQFRKSSYEYMLKLSQSDSIRFKLGEITENDARQSKLEASTLLNEVYDQEAAYLSSLAVLNQYMGKELQECFLPVGDLSIEGRNFDLQNLLTLAIENRLDLMGALKNSEIASNQLKLAKAERRIDIGLMVGYERDWKGFFPERDMLKGGFTIPLPFSNTNKGAVKSARLAMEKSRIEESAVQLQIQTEVFQAYYNYEAAKKKVNQYHADLLDDAKKLLDGVVYTYQRGESDILEVLIAQRTYNEIQEDYLETLKDYRSSFIELERAVGTAL